jgi:hypothetical protein
MTQFFDRAGLSRLLLEKLKSLSLWRYALFAAVFFHFLTWSFPFPSNFEVEKYLQGLRGETPEVGWIILTRLIDSIFGFGYAKFAFVLIGLGCAAMLYQVLVRIANQYVAIGGAMVFSTNAFIFTIWHRTQPEIVIALFYLGCVYSFVRFTTYWHLDLHKSANRTIFSVAALSFFMFNIDFNSACLMPSLGLMIFFVLLRLYSPGRALIVTTSIAVALGIVQWLLVPDTYATLVGSSRAYDSSQSMMDFFRNLRITYTDGYASDVWSKVYNNLDFMKLNSALHREREMFVYIFFGAMLLGVFLLKTGRLLYGLQGRTGFMGLVYNPHIPMILIFSVAFIFVMAAQIGSGGFSQEYLFFQVFILILLVTSIYSFFLMSRRENVQISSTPRWSELVYRPITVVACLVIAVLSLINSFYYVMPFRGSNYPTLYDTLERVSEVAECTSIAYAPSLYAVALARRQSPPAKDLKELYVDLNKHKPLIDGCIVLPLTAKDGVHEYSPTLTGESRPIADVLTKMGYRSMAHVMLPFYQKDPAYPFSVSNAGNPYQHAHGDPVFGFGGMQEVNIYRRVK